MRDNLTFVNAMTMAVSFWCKTGWCEKGLRPVCLEFLMFIGIWTFSPCAYFEHEAIRLRKSVKVDALSVLYSA